jgi:hypothetical protein
MKRIVSVLTWMALFSVSHAQIHVGKLLIKSKQKYSFEQSDILVADTLIMEDSSGIVLNKLKRENYLHTKVVIIGKQCWIDGGGVNGSSGRNGSPGQSPIGPCKNGGNGTSGTRGLDGTGGVNLFLYVDAITVKEFLTVDLHGGDGGSGGKGGEGGSGTSGTVHCKGGDAGKAGNAGNGANGGQGGTLTVTCRSGEKDVIASHLKVNNSGGRFGKGGRGGYPGAPGLGPKRGKYGLPGDEGIDGQLGKNGTVNFAMH